MSQERTDNHHGRPQPRQGDLREIHRHLLQGYQPSEHTTSVFLVSDAGASVDITPIDLSHLLQLTEIERQDIWPQLLREQSVHHHRAPEQVYLFAYTRTGRAFLATVQDSTQRRGWNIVHADATGCIDITCTPPQPDPTATKAAGPSWLYDSVLDRRLSTLERSRARLAHDGQAQLSSLEAAAVCEALSDPWIQFGCLSWTDEGAVRMWRDLVHRAPATVQVTVWFLLVGSLFLRGEYEACRAVLEEADVVLNRHVFSRPGEQAGAGATRAIGLALPVAMGRGDKELVIQQIKLMYLVQRMIGDELNVEQTMALARELAEQTQAP